MRSTYKQFYYINRGRVNPLPANVDTGIGRITADNIDEWIETVSAK